MGYTVVESGALTGQSMIRTGLFLRAVTQSTVNQRLQHRTDARIEFYRKIAYLWTTLCYQSIMITIQVQVDKT
jgi:hypothetical protein